MITPLLLLFVFAQIVVGEIIYIDESLIKVLLVGEIVNNKFISGIIKKPSAISNIRIIEKHYSCLLSIAG